MAKQDDTKGSKRARSSSAAEKKGAPAKVQQAKQEGRGSAASYIAAIAAIAILLFLIYFVFTNYLITSFSTFKSNFNSAPRVAFAITYTNLTQLPALISCSSMAVGSIAHTRKATTIDMFVLNATNCTYSPSGLGGPVNVTTTSASKCLAIARSEPSIFLNYSSANNTIITPYHMYIYANSGYLRLCSIAAEISS